MVFSRETMPSSTAILSASATLAASAVLLRSIAADLVPAQVHDFFFSSLKSLSQSPLLSPPTMFDASNTYLGAKLSPSTRRIKVNKLEKDEEIAFIVDKPGNHRLLPKLKLTWISQSTSIKQLENKGDSKNSRTELRFFELSFHNKHKDTALKEYSRYVLQRAIKEERKAVHTVDYNGTDYWSLVALNHPAMFDTIAMDSEAKKELIEDLNRFISRKDYYMRIEKFYTLQERFRHTPGILQTLLNS